jgi:diguanylate cyclase (GGDEF)-like protein
MLRCLTQTLRYLRPLSPMFPKQKPFWITVGVLTILVIPIAIEIHTLLDHRDIPADEFIHTLTLSLFGLFFLAVVMMIGIVNLSHIRTRSKIDPLTRLHNRHFLTELINPSAYHLIVVDIDYFKKINETYGRDIGDIVLHAVGQILKSHVREDQDHIIRLRGEEFLLLIRPDPRAPKKTIEIARSIKETIQNLPITTPAQETITLTVSLGIHLHAAHAISFDEALKQANTALYQAKNSGRNRIEHYDEGRFRHP